MAGNNRLVTDRRLTDADAEMLSECLRRNEYVTGLDLRYNNITDEGARHIAQLIAVSDTCLKHGRKIETCACSTPFQEQTRGVAVLSTQVFSKWSPSRVHIWECHECSLDIFQ